jgi:ornithine carbamoyltransferase
MNATATLPALTTSLATGMELSTAQVRDLLYLAAGIKSRPDRYRGTLAGRYLALIFEKPSLRTRVTFEIGMTSLGGASVFMDHTVTRLGERESVPDMARSLGRWVHGIVARTFQQESIDLLAEHSGLPVINALSDRFHPCQALTDFFTLEERFGGLRGLKLAYLGDGNNVCHSLLSIGARLGTHIRVATPAGYEPDPTVVAEARRVAKSTGGKIEILRSPQDAVAGVQAVYTDVWASMGQEDEVAERASIFAAYQVNEDLLALAAPDALFLHCLPAHRGAEISESVLESPRSIVFDQAENRLHVQKAVLLSAIS